MLFHVRMDVNLPLDMPADVAAAIKAREKAYSQDLQRSGKWRHMWRLAGEYAKFSIFDVKSNAELHDILTVLSLFPYMSISVTPFAVTRRQFAMTTHESKRGVAKQQTYAAPPQYPMETTS
jgi:muconolactone D-isomerase